MLHCDRPLKNQYLGQYKNNIRLVLNRFLGCIKSIFGQYNLVSKKYYLDSHKLIFGHQKNNIWPLKKYLASRYILNYFLANIILIFGQ